MDRIRGGVHTHDSWDGPGSAWCSLGRTLLTQTASRTISRTIRDGTFLPGATSSSRTRRPVAACARRRHARAHLRWLRCLTYIDGVDVQSPHACIRRQRNAVARANRRPGDLLLAAKSHT